MARKNRTHPRSRVKIISLLAWVVFLILFSIANYFVHLPPQRQDAIGERIPAFLRHSFFQFGNFAANLTDNLGITGSDASTDRTRFLLPSNQVLCAGAPRRCGVPAPERISIIEKQGFTIGYSPALRHPAWVAYRTFPCKSSLPLGNRPSFRNDPAAPASPRSSDYTRSGFDRGHMAPNLAIARRFGRDGQRETFLTSNICPQSPSLNQGPWRELEFLISEVWPNRFGSIWVITGALASPTHKKLSASAPIDVPIGFYQVVVAQNGNRLQAFAVYMPQGIRRNAYPRTCLLSIRELESLTGYDFLADLPDDLENALETSRPTRLWPSGFFSLFRILYERYRY